MPPPESARRVIVAATVVGALGWAGVVAIGLQLAAISPATLGFDLELLLKAGRDVAAGRSPYAAQLIGGIAPTATELFYSYPPPVALAMSAFAPVPSQVMLVGWGVLAITGLLAVSEALRRRLDPGREPLVVLAIVAAAAALTLPFAVGMLFGNLDVHFPALYGTVLLATLGGGRPGAVLAGAALVGASLKLHPASIGLWLLERGVRDRASAGLTVVGAAVVLGLGVVAASVLLGGIGLWAEYVAVVRAGTGAVIVDPRNAGIAAQVSMAVGGGDALARSLHVVVAIAAVALTVLVAWRRRDPVESFAWAAAASLSTLPVTWYHYPSAMIPVGVAAWLRAEGPATRRVVGVLAGAEVVAVMALVALPLLWVAVGLVILAARWSGARLSAGPAPGAG